MKARSYRWLRSLYHPEEVLKRCLYQLMKTDQIFLLMRYVVCWIENQSVVHRVSVSAWSNEINGVIVRPSVTVSYGEVEGGVEARKDVKENILRRLSYSVVSNPGITIVSEGDG